MSEMSELKKELIENAKRQIETYSREPVNLIYEVNGEPIPEGTVLKTNIPNARLATSEEYAYIKRVEAWHKQKPPVDTAVDFIFGEGAE